MIKFIEKRIEKKGFEYKGRLKDNFQEKILLKI